MLAEKGHGRVNSCPSQNVRRQDRRRKSLFQPGTSRLETCKNLPKKALEKQPFRIRKVRLKQLQRARPTQPQAGTCYSEFELLTQRGFLIQAPQGKKMGSVFLGSCHCQEKKGTPCMHTTHLEGSEFPTRNQPTSRTVLVFGVCWLAMVANL